MKDAEKAYPYPSKEDIENLKESEERYRSIFDNMINAAALHKIVTNSQGKAVNYTYVEVNKAFEQLTGLQSEQIAGKNVTEVLPGIEQESADWIRKYGKVALSGEAIYFEDYAVNLDKWFLIHAYCPMRGYFITIFEDITKQKVREEELQKSEEKFRKLYDSSPHMYVSVSPVDASIIQCNETLIKRTGYSREEILGSYVINLYHEDSKQAAEEAFKEFVELGEISSRELILKRKDGEKIHISLSVSSERDAEGKILHSFSSCRDIGEMILDREKALQETNKAQQYMDVAGVMLVSLDKDGVVQLINRKGCEVLGYAEDEIIGKNWMDNFLPDRCKRSVKEVSEIVIAGQGESLEYYENEILTKNGEEKLIAWHNATLIDEKGNVNGTLSSGEDITLRKQMEEQLINSELIYKSLYQNAPLPYHSLDQNGFFIEVNLAWLNALGYKKDEVLGKYYGDFLHPDWKNNFAEKFPKFKNSGTVHTTFKIRHKKGHYLDIDLNGNIGKNYDGSFKQTNCVFQDITETQKAREDLVKNQYYLKKAQEIATVGTWEIDLKENTIVWTEENYKIFGVPAGTKINYDLFLKCVHPDDRAFVDTEWSASLQGKPYDIEHRLLVNNETKWVREKADFQKDEYGNVQFVVGVTQDITRQKLAEERIRESEEKYRALYENAPLPYQSLNEDGSFRDVNPAWLETLGYRRNEVIGKAYKDFLHPDWKGHFEENFPKFKEKGSISEVEFMIRHKKGHYLEISFEGCIGYHPDGTFKQTYCVFQDITERKEAERLLKKSEHNFRLLADNTQDWEYYKNEKNEYVFLSTSCERITGYTAEEFYSNSNLLIDIVHPDYKDKVTKHYRLEEPQMSTSVFQIEFKIIAKDGTEKWIEHTCNPVYGEDRKFVGRRGNNRDITLRKISEEKLKMNEEMQRTILETAFDGFWIVDLQGKLLDVNKAYCEMSGFSMDELLKMNIADLDAFHGPAEVKEKIRDIKERGELQFESQHLKSDGSAFYVEMGVKYLPFNEGLLVVFIQDITQRKSDELELRLNESRLDTLVQMNQIADESLDAIYKLTLDKAIELTKSKIGFLGFTNEDETILTIHNWHDSTMKDANKPVIKVEFDVKKTEVWGEVVRNQDILVLNDYSAVNHLNKGLPAGHTKLKNYLSIPVVSGGKVVSMISVSNKDIDYTELDAKQLSLLIQGMWNIVEQRKEREELKLAKQKAEEADRLKSAFLANMSHEIRTPMNGILGFTNLLRKPNLTGEKQQAFIEIIQKSGDRMLSTVNDIIEISRIETGQVNITKSEVNINEQLKYYIDFFKPEADQKHIELRLKNELSLEESIIRTDIVKFSSIITNLIKNALKFSESGFVEIGCQKKEKHLQFYVRDSGIGIPEDRINAIFERFVQADIEDRQAHEGSGLGLAITKSFVEMLGGKIWLESEVGKGSVFYFTINYEPIRKMIEKEKSDLEANKSKAKNEKVILVAEDDEVSFILLDSLLAEGEYKLLWAKDGEEAIDIFSKVKDIDFILMDLKMPKMGGIEATRQIRKLNSEIPIIAQTAYALEGDREMALEAGCNEYISKPIDCDIFEKLIQKYC